MYGKSLVVIFFLIALTACNTTPVNTSYDSNYAGFDKNALPEDAQEPVNDDLWQLTRHHLQFSELYKKERVVNEIEFFNRYPLHMSKVSKQASPYYYYVLQEVIKRDFPAEVALLPVIESLYDPTAYSYGKAAGIWQFIPSTARYFGITIDSWYDGRRDVITSTTTALDYLAQLNKRFDGDWMLTFAAYNSGGGTVSKAMRKNREKNLPTDYWSLKLPKETTQYVPRILAISALVNNPQQYNIELPSIANQPYFKVIKLAGQTDLTKIAKIAKVSKSEILKLNPGFSKNVTSPTGPHRILLPFNNADSVELALNNLPQEERFVWQSYKIKSGDSLGVIAQKFGSSIAMIKDSNSLSSSRIRVGKTLLIPVISKVTKQRSVAKVKLKSHKIHTISDGDTLWDIAQEHQLSVSQILAFNGLSKNSTLRIGSSLKIPRG